MTWRREEIEYVDPEQFEELADWHFDDYYTCPAGFFYTYMNGVWCGMDNWTGELYIESFDNEEDCIKWLENPNM